MAMHNSFSDVAARIKSVDKQMKAERRAALKFLRQICFLTTEDDQAKHTLERLRNLLQEIDKVAYEKILENSAGDIANYRLVEIYTKLGQWYGQEQTTS